MQYIVGIIIFFFSTVIFSIYEVALIEEKVTSTYRTAEAILIGAVIAFCVFFVIFFFFNLLQSTKKTNKNK